MASEILPETTFDEQSPDGRFAKQLRQAALALGDCVEISPHKMGGVPVLRGTRFTLAQLLAQLADGDSLDDIEKNFDLDREQMSKTVHCLARSLESAGY